MIGRAEEQGSARVHARTAFRRSRLSLIVAGLLAAGSIGHAEDLGGGIGARIETVFGLVPNNPVDLAVPLTRRALAQRARVRKARALNRPDGPAGEPAALYQPLQLALPTSAEANEIVEPTGRFSEGAAAGPEAPVAQESAGAAADENAARLPRPRPERRDRQPGRDRAQAEAAAGDPLDLVAGAAGEDDSAQADGATAAPNDPLVTAALNRPAIAAPADPDTAADGTPGQAEADRTGEPAVSLEATQDAAVRQDCLPPDAVADRDDDFSRNADALRAPGICITQETFKERRRSWTLQRVETGRPGPLWAVVHDDEALSFDTAVQALATYGGKLIAVEAGGKRNQDGIDPNRNFSDADISCAKLGRNAAPKFAAFFRAMMDPGQPIIALHNNFDGHVATTGIGHLSMKTVPKKMRVLKSADADSPLASAHAFALLTAKESDLAAAEGRMAELSRKGVNVVLETVRKGKGDCSFSNYAVLSGPFSYVNVTVNHEEGDKQREIIKVLMPASAAVAAAE